MAHSEDEEEEEAQLSVAHLPDTAVVEHGLSPVRKPVNQDVIIPVWEKMLDLSMEISTVNGFTRLQTSNLYESVKF